VKLEIVKILRSANEQFDGQERRSLDHTTNWKEVDKMEATAAPSETTTTTTTTTADVGEVSSVAAPEAQLKSKWDLLAVKRLLTSVESSLDDHRQVTNAPPPAVLVTTSSRSFAWRCW
jgi:hypothetical protein